MSDEMLAYERGLKDMKSLADDVCGKQCPLQLKIAARIQEQKCRTVIAVIKIKDVCGAPKIALSMDVQVLRDTLEYLILVEHGLNTFYETVLKGATPDGN